jgi:hypothetical protein
VSATAARAWRKADNHLRACTARAMHLYQVFTKAANEPGLTIEEANRLHDAAGEVYDQLVRPTEAVYDRAMENIQQIRRQRRGR